MFVRDCKNQFTAMLFTGVVMTIGSAALTLAAKKPIWDTIFWIISALCFLVVLITISNMGSTIPVVNHKVAATTSGIDNAFLEDLANDVKRRFAKSNPGQIQQIKLANLCVSFLSKDSFTLEYLELKLSKFFEENVVLEYKSQYNYTPGIDIEDPRGGNFSLKIGNHDSVSVKIW